MKDTVCIYSGGMDSFTMVANTHAARRLHSALGFYYGQRHSKELDYARQYCADIDVPYHTIDLGGLQRHLLNSALTDASVELPQSVHHEDDAQRATVVPNRNMIMLSIAVGYAVSNELDMVLFGAHGGDRTVYPDCRAEFISLLSQAAQIAGWHRVSIGAPFIDTDKTGILRLGLSLNLDYRRAWTCYEGGALACGRCGSCRERLDAFARVGVADPMEYAR